MQASLQKRNFRRYARAQSAGYFPLADNQTQAKHVENIFATRLDAGSTPAGSTESENQMVIRIFLRKCAKFYYLILDILAP